MKPMTRQSHRSNRRCNGFTLVEVLVALLVLSIGVLGVGKLVLSAVKANDSSYIRGQAMSLTYAILDNMRANRQMATTGVYTTNFGSVATNPGGCEGASACASNTLAQYDLYRWKQRLTAALPSGDGKITTATTNGMVLATITVRWDDSVAQWAFGTAPTSAPPPTTMSLQSVL